MNEDRNSILVEEKLRLIAQLDFNLNGECINSPYYVKDQGKLYRGDFVSNTLAPLLSGIDIEIGNEMCV